MDNQLALQHILASRLQGLRTRYPSYSLRAFAKKAGISPATMSLLIQGKRRASVKVIRLLDERLNFDPQEKSEVLPPENSARKEGEGPYVQLRLDQYELISDWRCFAVLNLIATKGFRSDRAWIAKRLGVTVSDVEATISRLKRLEMLSETGGKLKRSESKYRTTEDIQNASLQRSHSQTLDLAQRSLESDPVELRDFSWATFAMDVKKMSAAKSLIRKFQDDLMDLVDVGSTPTDVYRLAVQLFPLTKTKKGNPT